MKLRDWIQQVVYKIIYPLVKGLVRMGVTPNMVTATGCLVNIIAAGIYVYGGFNASPFSFDYAILTWSGIVLFFGSLFDMVDGQVARIGNMASVYGAMFDSVLDRYSELITLFGICFYFFMCDQPVVALITFLAMVGSVMVSYIRARAEGLGLKCDVGLMQRPERVVLTSMGSLLSGLIGCIWILVTALALIALLSNITAFYRLEYSRKQILQKGKK